MDPNACLLRFFAADVNGDHWEATEAHEELSEWLDKGGFAPDWSETERARFEEWSLLGEPSRAERLT